MEEYRTNDLETSKMKAHVANLQEENKQLKSALEDAYDYKKKYYEVKKYEILAEKRREALRKCSPYKSYEYLFGDKCLFCNRAQAYEIKHTEDCEYVRLTK